MVKKFCCNTSLRTGGLIIGILELVLSGMVLYVMCDLLEKEKDSYEYHKLVIRIVMNTLLLLSALALILGTLKWRKKLLAPWLLVAFVYVLMKFFFMKDLFGQGSFMEFARDAAQIAIMVYFIFCIAALYNLIDAESREQYDDAFDEGNQQGHHAPKIDQMEYD